MRMAQANNLKRPDGGDETRNRPCSKHGHHSLISRSQPYLLLIISPSFTLISHPELAMFTTINQSDDIHSTN